MSSKLDVVKSTSAVKVCRRTTSVIKLPQRRSCDMDCFPVAADTDAVELTCKGRITDNYGGTSQSMNKKSSIGKVDVPPQSHIHHHKH